MQDHPYIGAVEVLGTTHRVRLTNASLTPIRKNSEGSVVAVGSSNCGIEWRQFESTRSSPMDKG